MNELGKPDGKRSRGCRYWWREPIHYDFGGLKPGAKGWTDDDWKNFKSHGTTDEKLIKLIDTCQRHTSLTGPRDLDPVSEDDDGREIIQPKD